jgi:hypothetical protein
VRFWYHNADEIFDLDRGAEFRDKELQQLFPEYYDLHAPKYVDTLAMLYTREGGEKWVLLHVEVQGQNGEGDFAERMFQYWYRLLDRYNQRVASIVILTDKNKKFRPSEYRYEFLGTTNIFRFTSYKVIDQDEKELAKSDNPFAIAVLTVLIALKRKKDNEVQLLKLGLALAKNLLKKNFSKEKTGYLMDFLKRYLDFKEPENLSNFEREITIITNNNDETMGIRDRILQYTKQEGIELGRIETENKKNFEFVRSLILKMHLSDEQTAEIAEVPVEFVKEVKKTLN